MVPIILIAHGSRDPNWQKPFHRFLNFFNELTTNHEIALCYMEICKPTLLDVCQNFYDKGVYTVHLVPMFMASGGHVDHDIPRQVLDVKQVLPDFSIILAPPIGEHPIVVEAMVKSLQSL